MCNLHELYLWLQKSNYFDNEIDAIVWENDNIVQPFCAQYCQCEFCPWAYIQVLIPGNLEMKEKKFSFLPEVNLPG